MTNVPINRIFTNNITTTITDIYLIGEVGDPSEYIEDFQIFRTANDGDVINLYINNVGGRVDTAVQYLSVMSSTKATVIAHLEGLCHSAATFLFLSADGWVVNKNSLLMVHNYSGGGYGKGQDLVQQVMANHEWVTAVLKDVYTGFLFDDEIDYVLRNNDMWLNATDILERLELLTEHRDKLIEAEDNQAREKAKEHLRKFAEEEQNNATENTKGVQDLSS